MRYSTRPILTLLALVVVADLGAWGVHLVQRGRAVRELEPVAAQLDSLRERIAEDDRWIDQNSRLMEGYGQHAEYAQRLSLRARRARAHDALVEVHNARLTEAYRRRYFVAPLPAPPPPLASALGTVRSPSSDPSGL